ncbi:hypothetical protein ACHAWT_002579 [Skeletonema menzelii]
MEQLDSVNTKLQAALDEIDRDRAAEITKLKDEEQRLLLQLCDFEIEKEKAAAENGNLNVSDNDIIEINVGGKIIAAKRGVLCQWKGTRLEALFSGRWDKMLERDSGGRTFLDLNGDCFQVIVDYMNELAISSEDDPPEYPTVNEELEYQFQHQLQLFGLPGIIDSEIIKKLSYGYAIRDWLNDGAEGMGELQLLYCSSRDGLSDGDFHVKCNNKGPTLTVIETAAGDIVGGYTNAYWEYSGYCSSRKTAAAIKAFLFALSGFGISSPLKMGLKDKDDKRAMDNQFGPAFGGRDSKGYMGSYDYTAEKPHDLKVSGSSLTLNTGIAYERGPDAMANNKAYSIKRIEVFSVKSGGPIHLDPKKRKQLSSNAAKDPPKVERFTKEVNEAINEKWKSLKMLEAQISSFQESFADEQRFIETLSLANGDAGDDIITLNVSGTMMATKRATLMVAKDSVLAQQFDDTKWTEQGNGNSPKVEEWTPDDVTNWVRKIKGVPDDVASLFWENEINGLELLALDKEGLQMLGIERVGKICLISDEIKSLQEKVNQDVVTFIEHSPYCFGKILDYLRFNRLQSINLAEEVALPTVCSSQQKRFEKVVKYYFPGESSSFILGPPQEN